MSAKTIGSAPAFPQHGWSKDPEVVQRMQGMQGLSTRAYIATEIAKAIASNPSRDATPGIIADEAVKVADAVIRELQKRESEA